MMTLSSLRIDKGVIVVKDGKAWGLQYGPTGMGSGLSNGWVDVIEARIGDPRFVTKPEDMTYKGNEREMEGATLVHVERRVITIMEPIE